MAHRDRVSRCFLSATLFMFLLALVANVTPVADLDGIAAQSTTVVSEPEEGGMLVAGTPHGPIAIDGDANFFDTALLEGWPGDGSPENPYIIDGLDIDLGGGVGDCISIYNTRVSFTISNCNLTGASNLGWDMGDGIFLENVTDGELVSNTCNSNWFGIELYLSDSNTVANNTCINNGWGIELYLSNFNTVTNNTCSNNDRGITLHNSDSNTVANNTCFNNTGSGIYLIASTDSLIVDNLIYNNTEIGIFLDWNCAHNRIYGNKIGWNGQNAICDGFNNSWDDGVSRGNSWSDYNFTSQYIVQGEGQCIDLYPSLWFLPRTYKGLVIFLLGGVLFLLPLGIVLGSRRHIALDIIQRTSYRLVFWCRKKKDDQEEIVVPIRYRLVSRFRKRWFIKRADVDES